MSKTARLLRSFSAVELLPEHRNYGNETVTLRELGVSAAVAGALIRWGYTQDLVCTFETGGGVGNKHHYWMPCFLSAAVAKHLELFGEPGKSDLPLALLEIR